MPISKESYEDLKPYWDFQRKKEFNKEKIKAVSEQSEKRVHNEFGMFWLRCTEDDYDDPHPNWIPEDPKLRFWWEGEPKPTHLAIESPSKRGRPVVLRAKNYDDLDSKIKDIFGKE